MQKKESGRHPIQVVARRTGLTPEVLRAWEKRYGAVRPSRTSTGRRLYSDADVERLTLLRQATAAGRRIGDVGGLPTDALEALVGDDRRADGRSRLPQTPDGEAPHLVERALHAIEALDGDALEASLTRALLVLSAPEAAEGVVAPVLRRVGDLWRDGSLDPYQEHMATPIIRRVLDRALAFLPADANAPAMAIATPVGQLHDLGALLAGLLAASVGWRVVSLGANLPAVEIARAAARTQVAVVALSLVYPEADPALPAQLRELRARLPRHVALIAGGSAVPSYRPALREIGAILLDDLRSLATALGAIRPDEPPRSRHGS